MDIDGHKLKYIILICIGWIIIQNLLAGFFTSMGFTPVSGGIDKIADALIFAFIWRFFVFILPIVVMIISTLIWMFQYERAVFLITIVLMIIGSLSAAIYYKYGRGITITPSKETAKLITYKEWRREKESGPYRYGISGRTENDYICEYVKDEIVDNISHDLISVRKADWKEKRLSYINNAMTRKAPPTVKNWEFVSDISSIVPKRNNVPSYGYLLNRDELLTISEHYNKALNEEHWNDRYKSKDPLSGDDFSSNYPMMMLFYYDGTMDIVVTAPFEGL